MNEAELGIIVSLQDQASPQLQNVNEKLKSMDKQVESSTTTLAANTAAVRQLGMGLSYLGTTALSVGIALEQTKNSTAQAIGQALVFSGALFAAAGSAIQLVSAIGRIVKALQEVAVMETIVNALSGPLGWIALAIAVVAGATAFGALSSKASDATDDVNQLSKATKELNGTLDTTTKVINGITFKWTSEGWMPTGSAATMNFSPYPQGGQSSIQSVPLLSGMGYTINVNVQGDILSEGSLVEKIRAALLYKGQRNNNVGLQ